MIYNIFCCYNYIYVVRNADLIFGKITQCCLSKVSELYKYLLIYFTFIIIALPNTLWHFDIFWLWRKQHLSYKNLSQLFSKTLFVVSDQDRSSERKEKWFNKNLKLCLLHVSRVCVWSLCRCRRCLPSSWCSCMVWRLRRLLLLLTNTALHQRKLTCSLRLTCSGLTPRIPLSVYRYFWAYPFLVFSFSFFLLFSCWFH